MYIVNIDHTLRFCVLIYSRYVIRSARPPLQFPVDHVPSTDSCAFLLVAPSFGRLKKCLNERVFETPTGATADTRSAIETTPIQ